MLPIVTSIFKALGARNTLALAKKPISKALGMNPTKPDGEWLSGLKRHLTQYPLSYSTVMGVLSHYAPDAVSLIFGSVDDESRKTLVKLLGSTGVIPAEYRAGADGDVDSVWGEDKSDFLSDVKKIKSAKVVVDDLSYKLGVDPVTAIDIAMLMRAVEPEFKVLYQD
jgi:hypothetical protein